MSLMTKRNMPSNKLLESELIKKPVAIFCIADQKNLPYARTMIKSLRYFHKDLPVILVTNEKDKEKLSENVIIKDLGAYLVDTMFFYRATPIIAEKLLDEYELVIKIDADSLILGDLSPVFEAKDYDVATVINWNRFDEKFYPHGYVESKLELID